MLVDLLLSLSESKNAYYLLYKTIKTMDMTPYSQQMDKTIQFFESELKGLQVGRASTWLVENITVEASYGPMKVPQVAHVTLMDAQTIKIEPRDKNEVKHVEKAIYDANIWLTPQNEWAYVLVKIPPLTEDRRTEIVKQVKAMGEEMKWRIRVARQDAMKHTKTIFDAKEIGEDEHKKNEKDVDALVKTMNDKIENLVKHKSEEIMTV